MIKSLKHYCAKMIIAGLLVIAPVAVVTPPASAQLNCAAGSGQANIAACLDSGTCLGATGANCPAKNTAPSTVSRMAKTVLNVLSVLVGVAAVIMIIIGGFKYIISSGDSSNIKSAKDTILYAIIGLVIVALAQVIVKFVLNKSLT